MQFPFHNLEKRKKILFLRPLDIFMQYKRQEEILKQVEIGFKTRKFMTIQNVTHIPLCLLYVMGEHGSLHFVDWLTHFILFFW